MELMRIERMDSLASDRIISKASDRIMSLSILMDDDMYKRIPKNKINYYISKSMKIGWEMSEEVLAEYRDVEEKCKVEKINIKLKETNFENGLVQLKGEYTPRNNSITICTKSLKEMELAYRNLKLDFLNYNLLYRIFLAQGLFQYIQAEEREKVSHQLDKVRVFKIIDSGKRTSIEKTNDIAASIFVKKLLDLPLHPRILSYLYFLGTGKTDENNILEYLNKLSRSL